MGGWERAVEVWWWAVFAPGRPCDLAETQFYLTVAAADTSHGLSISCHVMKTVRT